MATMDIRLQRVSDEYQSVRKAQDALFDKVDSFEAALLGLTESVAENRDLIADNRRLIMENRELIMENRELIMENRSMILEISKKLDAIMEHLKVPYKPPTGFVKD